MYIILEKNRSGWFQENESEIFETLEEAEDYCVEEDLIDVAIFQFVKFP